MVPAGETLCLLQVLEANVGREPASKQSWFFRETCGVVPIQESQDLECLPARTRLKLQF